MLVILVSLVLHLGLGQAEARVRHPEVGFLVVAPDRGFLGNEEVREVYVGFAEKYSGELVFATQKKTEKNIETAIKALKRKKVKKIWVLPLFLSPSNALYQKAVKVLTGRKWGVPMKIGDTMNKSYLTEEILKKRIRDLKKTGSKFLKRMPKEDVLVVIGYGAADEKGETGIREDLEAIVQSTNRSFNFRSTEVVVLYDRIAKKAVRTEASERVVERIALNRAKGERVLVVPFNFGRKATNMMAAWTRIKRKISKFDKVVADGLGVVPHKNVGIWLEKEANLRLPLSDDEIGVVLMPHGSDFNWNETIRENLSPLLSRYKIEYAFSMADPKVIERAVKRLENRGVRAIMLIRVYSLAASFREKTEYILGLNNTYRRGGMTMRVASSAVFTTFGGSEDHPLVAEVMLERAKRLSKDPKKETLILLGHGTDNEEVNGRWMNNLASLAEQLRKNGGSAFKDIRYYTWREDWPDKRKKAVKVIRQMIEEASRDGGTAILVPERTTGQGHADELIEGVRYRYATGFAPHPNFMKWIAGQIEKGKQILQHKVKKAGHLQGEMTEHAS